MVFENPAEVVYFEENEASVVYFEENEAEIKTDQRETE